MNKYIKCFEEFRGKIKITYPEFIDRLYKIYSNEGYDLYLVGGCVRDSIKGKTPKDFDLATNAKIDDTIELLKKNNIEYNIQGAHFGIVVAYDGDMDYEIAEFRSDIVSKDDYINFIKNYDTDDKSTLLDIIDKNDNYVDILNDKYPKFMDDFNHNLRKNQSVKLGVSIEDDVKRRDLSINALFYDIGKGEVFDLVGGVDDLHNNIIRMVGNPKDRISEDRLRILRIGRFLSRMDGSLSDDLKKELEVNNDIRSVSYERIWDEITKGFSTSVNINKYIDFLIEYNIIQQFLFKFDVNTNPYYTKNVVLFLASVLYNPNIKNNIANDLVKHSKIPYNVASKVGYLILFANTFSSDKVFNFYKQKNQFSVSDNDIIDFCEFLNKNVTESIKFSKYEPSYEIGLIARDNNIELDENGKPKNSNDGKRIGELINKFEEDKYNEL